MGIAARLVWILAALADRILGLTAIQQLYARSSRRPEPHFVDRALGALDVRCDVRGELADIPSKGALVIAANHPHGAIDGLALASVALRRRPDVKILGNRLLARIPELRDMLVPVDVFGGAPSAVVNARALRMALRWLEQGGCLCVFPAGEVAHGGWRGEVVEAAWHRSIARLATMARARTVRCTIEGGNGRAFSLAGLVHPRLRTALLPRMLLAKRGQSIVVRVGAAHDDGPTGRADACPAPSQPSGSTPATGPQSYRKARRGADPVWREVEPLLEEQTLVQQGHLSVFWSQGHQVPALLDRIGRDREEAFRSVGEGTGQDVDLDAFDMTYLHLCLWDRQQHRLAGAYRMGLADELARAGSSLYTQTLFDYDARWLSALGPSIELGRAFVAAPYQRQFAPLALLWSAIGRFVAARPRYRSLYGAVSIDTAYGPAARHAMVTYLQQHASAPQLSRLVTPRHPLTPEDLADARLAWAGTFPAPDVSLLDGVVARLDPRRRGVPVLLRQYLKLDARAVAFSIDPAFSHVLDTLVVVDLPAIPATMLKRFMGSELAEHYLRQQRPADAGAGRQAPRRRA